MRTGRLQRLASVRLSGPFLFFVVVGAAACGRLSPETTYQDVLRQSERGELVEAQKRADDAARRYSSGNTEWAWRFRVLDAHILVLRGQYDEGLRLLSDSPPASLDATDIAVQRKIVQGRAEAYLQKLDDAEKDLAIAERLAGKSEPRLLGEAAQARSILDFFRQDFQAMERDSRKALAIAREEHQPFSEARARASLGLALMRRERYDEAIDEGKAGLGLSRSLGARSLAANILGNMGWSYYQVGDFENALALFQQAAEASAQTGSQGYRLHWMISIADVYLVQRDFDAAAKEYQEAFALAKEMDDKKARIECLENLAAVAVEKGQLDAARQYNDEALNLALAGHDHAAINIGSLTAGRIESGTGNFKKAETLFQQVTGDAQAETAVRWEAEARLAEVYQSEGNSAAADREFQKSLKTIEKARAALSSEEYRQSFLTGAIEFYDDYVGFLTAQGNEQKALEVTDLSRAQTLLEGLRVDPAKISRLRQGPAAQQVARRVNAVILSYWLGPQGSYLWAIPPAGRVELFRLPPQKEIERHVKAFRDALLGPRDVVETRNAEGQKLYEILVAPAAHLITREGRVVILPDGALYSLNFETLLVPAPQLHYWIEDATVSTASSVLLLAAAARHPAAPADRLLLIGNPVSPGKDYPALPQAPAEMEKVQSFFAPAKRAVVSDAKATALSYLQGNPGSYAFIHFVAHGTANRTSPLESAIILSKDGDSFKLYARDIVTRPLHANLVTVSSCFGAGTRAYAGEGLVGLSWAFLRAGAHNVIGALWEVSDISTPRLMEEMYRELTAGRDPATALRTAKLSLLHSDTVYKKPFYWAAFQLYAGL